MYELSQLYETPLESEEEREVDDLQKRVSAKEMLHQEDLNLCDVTAPYSKEKFTGKWFH